MSLKTTAPQDLTETLPPAVSAQGTLLLILAVLTGALFAINLLPLWLPGLAASTAGSQPKVYWYLARGSAIAAYWILWLALSMGILITNKLAQQWPGIPPAYEIHQYTSLLGLGFALFHALILMGDQYIHFTLVQVFLPFSTQDYKPFWVGIGQAAFYLWLVITASFYVRKQIGKKAWRVIHYTGYAAFLAVMLHGLAAGTDASAAWTRGLYWFSGASLLFLTIYRILTTRLAKASKK